MMRSLPALVFFIPSIASANPVAMASVEKTWERCVIRAGLESSTVSCAVGYKTRDDLSAPLYIHFPVIVPTEITKDPAKLRELIQPRMEVGGEIEMPKSIEFGELKDLPGASMAYCHFTIKLPAKSFSLVASYEQPTIDGTVHYLPQFEWEKNPKNISEFSISFFPSSDATLALLTTHKERVVAQATRITVHPSHGEIIKVGITKSPPPAPVPTSRMKP